MISPNHTKRSDGSSLQLITILLLSVSLLISTTLVDGFASPSPTSTTTKSGLQYVDLVVGDGNVPGSKDFVSVHYEGKIKSSGKVFGATRGKTDLRSEVYQGDPFSFKLGKKKVIPGWEEGISTMKVGGKRRLTIPSDLAYGEEGTPDGVIPKSADLIFDVELVSIDGNMGAIGGLATGFQIAIGLIVINSLTAVVTGHELREYINGSLN